MVNDAERFYRGQALLDFGAKGIPMRVLLIEDEPTTARAIELMLTTEGFNVYSTDLGEEGVDLGKLYDYDIILLDLNLPDMTGVDVLAKVKGNSHLKRTPVVILTTSKEEEDLVASYKLGANSYVRKPVDFGEFAKVVNSIGLHWLLLNEAPPRNHA